VYYSHYNYMTILRVVPFLDACMLPKWYTPRPAVGLGTQLRLLFKSSRQGESLAICHVWQIIKQSEL
jgi:hypothetical protein